MARNTKKLGKGEIHTLGNGIWQKTLKNMKNEKHTLQDQDYGEETEKRCKNKMHNVGPRIWQETHKNNEIDKYTMQGLDFEEKTEKHEK